MDILCLNGQSNREDIVKRIAKHKVILLLLTLLLACTGCGKKEEKQAKETCEAFFAAYVKGDSAGQ